MFSNIYIYSWCSTYVSYSLGKRRTSVHDVFQEAEACENNSIRVNEDYSWNDSVNKCLCWTLLWVTLEHNFPRLRGMEGGEGLNDDNVDTNFYLWRAFSLSLSPSLSSLLTLHAIDPRN